MNTKTRRRQRTPCPGPLQHALTTLTDAIDQLTAPQPHHPGWIPSRYTQLREAVNITSTRAGAGNGTNRLPLWIDPWMLADRIETRTYALTRSHTPLPQAWHNTLHQRWRPQDTEHLEAITAEILGWCKAIDDLFAPKPIDLDAACPQCGQTHTYRQSDTGERERRRALILTPTPAVICQSCHVTWPHERLEWLGQLLRAPSPHNTRTGLGA